MSPNTGSTVPPGTVEKAHSISTLTNTEWAKPDYTLPSPTLRFLFHLECDMSSFHRIGNGGHGQRSTVIFRDGRFEGPLLRGTILPGGGDWETVLNSQDHNPSSFSLPSPTNHGNEKQNGEKQDTQTAFLDTRYNLMTHDGVCIYLQTTGARTGKKEVIEGLGEEGKYGADEYRMRLSLKFEVDEKDERYGWLNGVVGVACAGRNGDRVIYDAWAVL